MIPRAQATLLKESAAVLNFQDVDLLSLNLTLMHLFVIHIKIKISK